MLDRMHYEVKGNEVSIDHYRTFVHGINGSSATRRCNRLQC